MMPRKEGRNAGQTGGARSSIPPKDCKGCKRHGAREGRMLRSTTRDHPFDPRHDALHELLREIVQPLGLSATTRSSHVLR
jgi:hypothetical protein